MQELNFSEILPVVRTELNVRCRPIKKKELFFRYAGSEVSSHSLGGETRDRRTQVHTHKQAPTVREKERDEVSGLKERVELKLKSK